MPLLYKSLKWYMYPDQSEEGSHVCTSADDTNKCLIDKMNSFVLLMYKQNKKYYYKFFFFQIFSIEEKKVKSNLNLT